MLSAPNVELVGVVGPDVPLMLAVVAVSLTSSAMDGATYTGRIELALTRQQDMNKHSWKKGVHGNTRTLGLHAGAVPEMPLGAAIV
jgi:hypothetical protein